MGNNEYISQLPPATFGGSLGAMRGEEMRRLANRSPSDLAVEFEAVLLAQVIKVMRESVPDGGLLPRDKSHGVYDGLFDMEVARAVAKGARLGLARELGSALERMGENAGARGGQGLQSRGATMGRVARPARVRQRQKARAHTDNKGAIYLRAVAATSNAARLRAPLRGAITSGFGYRTDPISGERRFHYGVDIAAPRGTPIKAVAPGRVSFSAWLGPSSGKTVILTHEGGLTSVYRHAQRLLVKEGQKVAAGEVLALVGESGRTTGPHLHFELSRDGQHIDPKGVIEQPSLSAGASAGSQNSYTGG